jgi:hypothetical protein
MTEALKDVQDAVLPHLQAAVTQFTEEHRRAAIIAQSVNRFVCTARPE